MGNVTLDTPLEHGATPDEPVGATGGFPGPWLTGATMVVAPLLALLGTIVGIPTYHARGTDFVAGMTDHPHLFDLAIQSAQASMVLMILAIAGLSAMITRTRPGLGRWAGALTIIGLCGPISFESTYWAAWHITDTDAHRAAAAQLIDDAQVIPRTIMNLSGPALVVGFLLLAVAAAKAGVLDRARAVCLGLTVLIPVGFVSGHLVIATVGFAGTAVALVPLGVRLLRGR
jgi:hypothetical protein